MLVICIAKGVMQEQGAGQAEKKVVQKRNTSQQQVADESKKGWHNLRGVEFKVFEWVTGDLGLKRAR
jgi:hypothetical protein